MMKICFALCISMLAVCFHTQAQFTKGSILLGGNVGFSSSRQETNSLEKTSANKQELSLSKLFKNNEAIGFQLMHNGANNKSYSSNNTSNLILKSVSNSYGIGIFYTRYFNLSQRLYAFAEPVMAYNYGSSKTYTTNTSTLSAAATTNQVGVQLNTGLSFFISKKVIIDLGVPNIVSFYYMQSKSTLYPNIGTPLNSNNKNFSASINGNHAGLLSNITIGFTFQLSNKK